MKSPYRDVPAMRRRALTNLVETANSSENESFMIVARRVLIGGRVQGVGFRMFAAARAAAEGIHGHARNLPDGRVEVVMEGDDEAVDRMELALRRGPSHADVESFDVEDTAATHRTTGFSTR